MNRPLKRSRETRRLIDALGGGLETTAPRSARTARKLTRQQNTTTNTVTLSSSPRSSTRSTANHHLHRQKKELGQKNSDSSLSELSDSFDPPTIPTISLPPPPPPAQEFISHPPTPSPSSIPSTPNSNTPYSPAPSMKTSAKNLNSNNNNNSSSLRRKTIIKRSSNFSFVRPHHLHPVKSTQNRAQRNRKLTEAQKREIEQTRIKLLENLEKEEELIRSSRHPILISLEENVKIGREIKLNQARQKFDRLLSYLNALHFERQQRIWDTCIDKKIRLRNEMIVDCQIRLNRAPFEFLISNDTTNLQAIFHLTPTPSATYNRPKVSVSQEMKEMNREGTRSNGMIGIQGSTNWMNNRTIVESTSSNKTKKKEDMSKKNTATIKSRKNQIVIKQDHQEDPDLELRNNMHLLDSDIDLIDGLIHHKIRHHNVWQLSSHDVDHDLKLIKKPLPTTTTNPHPPSSSYTNLMTNRSRLS